ncbi:MAG: hypothetical protein ACHQX1_03325 [Candidatus Micrarchaeales archaeon]
MDAGNANGGYNIGCKAILGRVARLLVPSSFLGFAFLNKTYAGYASLQVIPELTQIQIILSQVGPALSTVLFILAGVFYALGQMLPPDKKAQFHTTAVNIIIGAIVLGALSVAATSLATASTHLLQNVTANGVTNLTTNSV